MDPKAAESRMGLAQVREVLAEPFALGQNAHAWRALCASPPENTVARASA
ncbi:MAG: hypothetical protein L6Q84_10880 [Polyangiaceae bacterium]|nr:hypothetical protein [Polyangiaceae bacterium]